MIVPLCMQWHSGLTGGYLPWDRGFNESELFILYDYYSELRFLFL